MTSNEQNGTVQYMRDTAQKPKHPPGIDICRIMWGPDETTIRQITIEAPRFDILVSAILLHMHDIRTNTPTTAHISVEAPRSIVATECANVFCRQDTAHHWRFGNHQTRTG